MQAYMTDRISILTVEDDSEEAYLTRRFLQRRLHAQVDIAGDADTARELLGNNHYDVVLVDTVDAGDPEFCLLEEIAQMDEGFAVVVVTGHGDERLAAKALEVGAVGYVMKDANMPGALVKAVENAMLSASLKRAESFFNMQQAITESAFNILTDIFFAIDLRGSFIKWNKALCTVTGYQDDDFFRMRLPGILARGDITKVVAELARVERGKPRTFDIELRSQSGDTALYELTAGPLTDPSGTLIGHLVLGRDVTSAREECESLCRENEELDDFAQAVSHDLKRPLSAMMLAAETLLRIMDKPDQCDSDARARAMEEMAQMISEECRKAADMISSMLQLAESAQIPEELEDIDLSNVIAEVLEEISPAIQQRGVGICVGPGLGRVRAQATQVYRLFSNLIGNAVEHADADSLIVEIRNLPAERGYRRFLVRDNGKGIDEDALPYVFRPFFSSDASGTGIGLAIARKIVKMYGGEIRAYNDNGACFEFTLRK
jgi:PAS domain S-box-containing protein